MNWYDQVVLVIMVIVTIAQTIRGVRAGGVGLPLFEAAGVVIAAAGATAMAHLLAGSIRAEEDVVLLVLFIVFSVLAFFVAHWFAALTALSFQSLDGIFSFLCGVVMAWAIANMFFRIMMASAGGEAAAAIANSPVAREVYQFQSWNELMRLLFNVKGGQSFDPTES